MPVNEKIIAKGAYLALIKRGNYEFVARIKGKGVVALLPVTNDQKIILVEQWREPVQKQCLELPAGLVSDEEKFADEDFISAAHRELEEETGYVAKTIKLLADFPTTSGMSSERVSLYLCEGLEKCSAGGGDHSENITVHEVALTRLLPWLQKKISEGLDVDYKIYAAAFLYEKQYQP